MMYEVHYWPSWEPMRRISLISAVPILASIGILGEWMSWQTGRAVMDDIGLRSNLYFQAILGPHVPDMSEGGDLSPGAIEEIRRSIEQASSTLDIAATKVWSSDGRIIFASDPSIEGQDFPIDASLAEAFMGGVVVETGGIRHREAYYDDQEFIESYVPIRETPNGPVVVVAETYQNTSAFMSAVVWTRFKIWLAAGVGALSALAGLSLVNGQRVPPSFKRRSKLEENEPERDGFPHPAGDPRSGAQAQSAANSEEVERQLRRIGADLHDGIGQLLAVTILKLEVLFPQGDRDENYRSIRGMLDEAVSEVRAMAAGLMLPHVQEQSLEEAVGTVVLRHCKRTSTEVALALEKDLGEPDLASKIAICRFVQEGLTNAFKHAGGAGQSVNLCRSEAGITVIVQDRGPGIVPGSSPWTRQPLGLLGLRDRLEGLGGKFEISSVPGEGTTIYGHFH